MLHLQAARVDGRLTAQRGDAISVRERHTGAGPAADPDLKAVAGPRPGASWVRLGPEYPAKP